ncbi:hypothetical protein Pmani_015355 [Petrolisthes manimaculis]|uniref:Mesoderm induction early response protein 1 n=1 Tax=Petrolisthes manimaculis TaxID=1843537 RepID=A0AAE1PU34_9EUCA|nr:hypothetical protein Pmani_015355 [Petrolisthes manimaculis]
MAEKESAGTTGSESDAGDGEFEPTAEMLVDDFDDERTLDEEEDMEEGTDREEEIDNLEKEQDMPIAQLLAMYGGYPPEEGEAEAETEAGTEEQANGEGEVSEVGRTGPEPTMSNEEPVGGGNEGEQEVEEADEPEVVSSRSSTSEETVNNHEKKKPSTITRRSVSYILHRPMASEENLISHKKELKSDKPERKRKEKSSELAQLYADMDTNGDTPTPSSSRSLRGHKPLGILSTGSSRQQSEDEEEDEGEYSGEEEDWHKTIMIGSSYQAQVPEGLQAYGATPPYENEDKLLWEPGKLNPKQIEQIWRHHPSLSHSKIIKQNEYGGENIKKFSSVKVEEYLRTLSHPPPGSQGVAAIPLGKHVRDDEQALYLLLQCGYNVDEALRRHRMNPAPLASTMTLWSEEECRNFENGLKTYGKDFHLIQQNKVRTRSVGELVQFYYLWKKTERHDLFATKTRIEKKKYIVHPGTTDYMDRFLDEGEGVVSAAAWRDNRSSSPSLHALLYGRPPPGAAAGVTTAAGGPEVTALPLPVTAPLATQTTAVTDSGGGSKNPVSGGGGGGGGEGRETGGTCNTGLNQMEDLARHLDADSIESLAKIASSSNAAVSIARTGKRTSSPHPMDVDVAIARSSVLSSQTMGVEPKSVAMTEAVAQ